MADLRSAEIVSNAIRDGESTTVMKMAMPVVTIAQSVVAVSARHSGRFEHQFSVHTSPANVTADTISVASPFMESRLWRRFCGWSGAEVRGLRNDRRKVTIRALEFSNCNCSMAARPIQRAADAWELPRRCFRYQTRQTRQHSARQAESRRRILLARSIQEAMAKPRWSSTSAQTKPSARLAAFCPARHRTRQRFSMSSPVL